MRAQTPCKNRRRTKLWSKAPGIFCGDSKVARAPGENKWECLGCSAQMAPACTCCQLAASLAGSGWLLAGAAGLGPGDGTPTGPRHTKQSIRSQVGELALAPTLQQRVCAPAGLAAARWRSCGDVQVLLQQARVPHFLCWPAGALQKCSLERVHVLEAPGLSREKLQ